jgi:DinB family protein
MKETLETLRAFQSRLVLAVHGIAEEDLRRLEREGGWAILDVIAHLGDLELVYAVRMRDILAGSGDRTLQPLAQDAWVERVHRRDESVAELLEQLSFHRRMNLALFERLSGEELDRTGVHPQYGTLSVRDIAGRLERHDAKHLGQIERIKTALGLRASETPETSGVVAGALLDERRQG